MPLRIKSNEEALKEWKTKHHCIECGSEWEFYADDVLYKGLFFTTYGFECLDCTHFMPDYFLPEFVRANAKRLR